MKEINNLSNFSKLTLSEEVLADIFDVSINRDQAVVTSVS